MLHAYDYETGQGISVMNGPEGLQLLGPTAADMDMAPVPAGMQLLGPADYDMAPVPAGMQLLGAEGLELLGPYDIGLMAAAEGDAKEDAKKDAVPTFSLGVDYACTGKNVCTPATNSLAGGAYKELQNAINRAIVQFPEAGQKPITVDGVIGPDVMVAAWRVAKHLGPESDPLFKEIGEVDLFDAPQVKAYAVKLATNPLGYKTALDKLSISAASEEKKTVTRVSRRRGWLAALAIVASLGAVAGVVIYSRKAG